MPAIPAWSWRRWPRERAVEAGVVAVLAFAVAALSVWGYELFGQFPPLYQHLGGEYYNIGRAIAEGRGFADPFAEPTGPTAWMPPLFPLMLAGLIRVLGSKGAVAVAVVILTGAGHVYIGWTIFRIARVIRGRISPLVAPALYLAFLCLHFYWFFEFTHDIWLTAVAATVVVWLAFRYMRGPGRPAWWSWGLAGGLAAATSPSIAFGWTALSVAAFLRARAGRAPRADRRRLVLAAALAAALVAPWIARNAVVFGRFIPIKSNLFFDAYQANVVDDDGVYDHDTTSKHPYRSARARFAYARLGESAFLDTHKRDLGAALRDRPFEFARRAGNRLLAATLLYHPMVRDPWFSVGDVARFMLFPLPLLALVVALGMRRREDAWLLPLVLFAATYLIPYVAVAFYMRYLMPLSAVLVLLVFAAAERVAVEMKAAADSSRPVRRSASLTPCPRRRSDVDRADGGACGRGGGATAGANRRTYSPRRERYATCSVQWAC